MPIGTRVTWSTLPIRRSGNRPRPTGEVSLHDTNRDGIVLSQPATRALLELFDSFHPQVIDDFHESLPFLYIFTGTGPNYPNYGPIYETELSWLAHYELAQMSRWGMPGVWVYDFAQAWYRGT